MAGREKRPLGDLFGLTNFGVKLTRLAPGALSALEVGDRTPGDGGTYPDDDIQAALAPDGTWRFTRKNGTPY